MRKRFDRELYNQTDQLAKKSVKKLLKGTKFKVVENPKKTHVDLLILNDKNEHCFNIECEIKRVWKDKEFQYDSVNFPERKAKYAKLDKPTLFVMFNVDATAYLTVIDKKLLASPLVEVPNKYVFKGEKFYQIPLKKVIFNDIKKSLDELLKKC